MFFFLFSQVTSDVHNLYVTGSHITVAVFYSGIIMRTLFGYLPFWTTFMLVEMFKYSIFAAFSVLNVSTCIQTALILNYQWVYNYNDKVVDYYVC